MGMIQLNMSDEDRQILAVERFEHPHPRVQRNSTKRAVASPVGMGYFRETFCAP